MELKGALDESYLTYKAAEARPASAARIIAKVLMVCILVVGFFFVDNVLLQVMCLVSFLLRTWIETRFCCCFIYLVALSSLTDLSPR